MTFAPASFRDPDARVLRDDRGRILRALSDDAAALDARLRASGLLDALVRDGLLVESWPSDAPAPPGWAAVIESRRLPFPSYPYEWSFGMLQDAGLLTLRLTARALADDVALKDASAYNVFFEGARPLFIDVASFAAYEAGTPWLAYGQFCDHFLAPLMLEAYRGVRFQPLLRSSLEGLSVTAQLAPLLSARDLLRPGVVTHVKLRAALDRRTQGLATGERRAVRGVTLPKQAVLANVVRLERLVRRLRSTAPSVWADYEAQKGYGPDLTARKEAFVEAACARVGGGRLAWDVGANTGRFSRVLARHFDTVAAMDADAGAVDALYRGLGGTDLARRILPLVIDLMNPSPAQGWRGGERAALAARGRPELALYLALVHHVCLGRGVPLADFLDFVRETSPAAVVEFVAPDDPMSRMVLASKGAAPGAYTLADFRALARARGAVLAEETLSPTRALFLLARAP